MQAETQTLKQSINSPAVITLAIAGSLAIVAGWLVGPIVQDLNYHLFADQRTLAGIDHCNDVLTNLPFCLFGLGGLYYAWRRREILNGHATMYLAFFAGVFLTGFGSAYYHLDPNNATLVWDRLPMTIGFMSLFALILAERIDDKLGRKLFPILLLAGIASVFYWDMVDDLRPYLLVQFGPMLALPYMLFKHRRAGDLYLWLALGFYLLAKILEAADAQVFLFTAEWVSGHSLKHVAASVAPLMILLRMSRHGYRA